MLQNSIARHLAQCHPLNCTDPAFHPNGNRSRKYTGQLKC